MTLEEIDFRAANPYTFSRGQIQISGCYGGYGGWNWDIQLIYDGQDFGYRRYSPRVPGDYYMQWEVPDGIVKITELWRSGQCAGSGIGFRLEYPGAGVATPVITYLKVSDLGDGRIWVDYGVQGQGNVKITIDGVIVKTFNNPYDSYSYADAFSVAGGTHNVCVDGVA